MKTAYIVTEGSTDKTILKTVLDPEILTNVDIVVGSGRYSAQSLAHSIVAMERTPVALVVDADTTAETAYQEQLDLMQFSLGQASAGIRYEVFLAKPEIEILLVQDWSFIEQVAHKTNFSEIEKEFAQNNPKKFILSVLGPGSYAEILQGLLNELDDKTIEIIREYPLVSKLNKFLLSVSHQHLEPSHSPTLHTVPE